MKIGARVLGEHPIGHTTHLTHLNHVTPSLTYTPLARSIKMEKDFGGLGRFNENKWWNRFPKNPTQTAFLRFKESPAGELKSMFSKKTFDSKFKNPFEGGEL